MACLASNSMALDCGARLFVNRNDEHGAFIVASVPYGGEPALAAGEVYHRLAEILEAEQLQIVQERVFGSLSAEAAIRAARCKAFGSQAVHCPWPPSGGLIKRQVPPLNYLPGSAMHGETFAGLIVRALPAGQTVDGVRSILEDGVVCGSSWRTRDALHVILQDVRGLDPDGDNAPEVQAQRAINRAQRLLNENGADYRHVVRTWFYLSDILSWYKSFNEARTGAYEQFGLLSASQTGPILPASTGIRADIGGGAACSLDLLAVVPLKPSPPRHPPSHESRNGGGTCRLIKPPDGGVRRSMNGWTAAAAPVQFLRNARQQEAWRYGSAFSRCAVIAGQRERLIQVSGTAAIDEAGHSVCLGDVRAQVRCTLDKVSFLLAQADCALPDIQAATVFVKNPDDLEAVRAAMAEAGLADLPAVYVIADVCRDELLFEIDAEAVVHPSGAVGT